VLYQRIETEHWDGVVRGLIAEHVRETQSRFAEQLLIDWRHERHRFWQIVPKEMVERLEHPIRREAVEKRA
jgi:glutamate synthase (NADPH/NADH) large chain